MLLATHFVAAFLLPASQLASRPAAPHVQRTHLPVCSVVGDLRACLESVKASAPLPASEREEVLHLCEQIAVLAGANTAASRPPTAPAAPSAPFSSPAVSDVVQALTKLFNTYDTDNDGYITMTEMMAGVKRESVPQNEWSKRQARAGARRMRRRFSKTGKISLKEFVSTMSAEFAKRIERGLAISVAVAEILANLPERAIYAEVYGSE